MEYQKPHLSVGIVMRTKNRAILLKRAIESVLHQTYEHWYLIIVNDGGEAEIVDELINNYSEQAKGRIDVVHNPKSLGMEAASNIGLNRLSTDLAVIHDDDDSWASGFLHIMTATYINKKKEYPSVGGVVCYVNRVLESVEGNIVKINEITKFNQNNKEGLIPLKTMLHQNQFPPIAFIFELKKCKDIGMYDEYLPVLGDWDFHLRFMTHCDIWLTSHDLAFYHHRLQSTGDMGNSIIAGVDKHQSYRIYLENKWLRNDICTGNLGLGTLIYLQNNLEKIVTQNRTSTTIKRTKYLILSKILWGKKRQYYKNKLHNQ